MGYKALPGTTNNLAFSSLSCRRIIVRRKNKELKEQLDDAERPPYYLPTRTNVCSTWIKRFFSTSAIKQSIQELFQQVFLM